MTIRELLARLLGRSTGAGHRGSEASSVSCEEALRLVQDFLDGELDDVPRARVQRHFEICRLCYPHLRRERSFRAALRKAAAGECASQELRERVLKALEEASPGR